MLDPEIYSATASKSIEQDAADEAARIARAIAEGRDPNAVAAPAAAGGETGDEGTTTPLVLDFDNTQGLVNSGYPTGPISLAFPTMQEELPPVIETAVVLPTVVVIVVPPDGEDEGIQIVGSVANVIEGTQDVDGTPTTKPITFQFQLVDAAGNPYPLVHDPVTVTYHLEDGTAVFGEDYNDGGLGPFTVTIPSGSNTYDVTINIVQDGKVENDQAFSIVLDSATGANIGAESSFTVNIINDDAVQFNISGDTSVTEGVTAAYTISYTGTLDVGQTATVYVDTGPGTTLVVDAASGLDYNPLTQLLTFTGGGASTASVSVVTLPDSIVEGTEEYTVNLSAASSNATIGTGTVTTEIVDGTRLTVSISDATSVNEGTALLYTVTLSGGTATTAITIPLTYAGTATPVLDYAGQPVMVTIPAGATSATVTVPTLTDALVEGSETVVVNLGTPSNAAVTVVDGEGTGTILDTNVPPPNVLNLSFTANSNQTTQYVLVEFSQGGNTFSRVIELTAQGQQSIAYTYAFNVGFNIDPTLSYDFSMKYLGNDDGAGGQVINLFNLVVEGTSIDAASGNVKLGDGGSAPDGFDITIDPSLADYTLASSDLYNRIDASSGTTVGTAGDDAINGSKDADNISGGDGYDLIMAAKGDDTIYGGAGNDGLTGGEGNDILYGEAGTDLLSGGIGNDILNGGDGTDFLYGGVGNDTLIGGDGKDTFVWLAGDAATPATDTITGFIKGVGGDVLDLSSLLQGENSGNIETGGFLTSATYASGNTTLVFDTNGSVSGGDTQTIVIQGVDLTNGGLYNNSQVLHQLLLDGNLKIDS
jgi:Ca2+-binding RTX toxin-like protein